jgi:hypothetical protein
MKRSKEEKRERLLARAEQVVDEYLAWEETHPRPDLTQILVSSMHPPSLIRQAGGLGANTVQL